MLTLYGLKNCDGCRKAIKQLNAAGIDHRFHDIRADGIDASLLDRWLESLSWEELLNRKSRTWRDLGEADKIGVEKSKARELMLAHPTLIKRPVVESDRSVKIGIDASDLE